MISGNAARIERAKRRVWALGCLVGLFILLLLLAILVAIIPYEPITAHSYSASEREVCPGERVDILVDYQVKEGALLTSIKSSASWRAEDVSDPAVRPGSDMLAGELTLKPPSEALKPGRHGEEIYVLRRARAEPGEWRAVATWTIRGKVLGFIPDVQTLAVADSKTVTVLDPKEHPECEGRGGEV